MATSGSCDSLQSIRSSTLQFFSGTMLSRVSGLIREISLAYCFGNSSALASFFVALRLTFLLRRLFGEGSLQSSFIPLFEQARKENQYIAFSFFRDLTVLWVIFLTLISIFGMLVLYGTIHILPISDSTKDIMQLMLIMFPSIVPICLFGLNISLLQAEKRYFITGFSPAFFNFAIVIAAHWFRASSSPQTMEHLAYAVVTGCLMQWLVTLAPSLNICKKELGTCIWNGLNLFSSSIKKLYVPIGLSLVGLSASQINNAIDSIFAYSADGEGPAQLWYAIRFQQLPLALFSIAISNAVLPPLCRAYRDNNTVQFSNFVEHGIRQTIALLLPCTGGLLVVGGYIINCFYGHGAFSQESVIRTTPCLQGYALGLVPSGIIIILAPAFYARRNYTIPTSGACLALIANIFLNSFFVYILQLGALSISIATSISSAINCRYLYTSLSKNSHPIITKDGVENIFKTCICTLAASGAVALTCFLLFGPIVFFGCTTISELPRTIFSQLIEVSFAIGLFIGVLFLSALATKATDILDLMLPLLKKFGIAQSPNNIY